MNVTKVTLQLIGAQDGPVNVTKIVVQYLAGFIQPIYTTKLTYQLIVSKPQNFNYLGAQTPETDFVY